MTDRDRLIELLQEYTDKNNGGGSNHGRADHLLANGVIVQKQGEWKQTKEPLGWKDVDCVECSACHESWMCDEDFDFECCKEFWKYCPHCGAVMVS